MTLRESSEIGVMVGWNSVQNIHLSIQGFRILSFHISMDSRGDLGDRNFQNANAVQGKSYREVEGRIANVSWAPTVNHSRQHFLLILTPYSLA